MTGLSAADLAGIRTTVNTFLPSSTTNGRTSVVSACRVDDAKRDWRASDMPRFMVRRLWKIVMPDGVDVQAGDALTVSGKGTYVVLLSLHPTDYSIATEVLCLHIGGVLFTDSVTFTNLKTNLTTPATNATIWRLNKETMPAPWSNYDWAIAFQPVTYSDTTKPGDGHLLNWSGVRGEIHITRPYSTNDPTMPLLMAFFKDPD